MATTKSTRVVPKSLRSTFTGLREEANEAVMSRKNEIQTTPITISNSTPALVALYTEVIIEQNEYIIKLLEMLVEKSSG